MHARDPVVHSAATVVVGDGDGVRSMDGQAWFWGTVCDGDAVVGARHLVLAGSDTTAARGIRFKVCCR